MPSRRPSAPRPSARLPFTVTGAPTASARRRSHLLAVGRQLGRLQHDRAVDVAGLPARRPDRRHGATEQVEAVGAGQGGIGVGEVLADVAEAGGAEERVGHGVGDDIGIAVAGQTGLAVEPYPTQHQRAVGVVAEGVDVEALPHPHRQRHSSSATSRSCGRGDLEVGRVALHDHHPATCRLDQRRIVGALRRVGVGRSERVGPERLRGLHGHEPGSVHGRPADLAERVGDRDRGHRGIGARRHRGEHPVARLRAPAPAGRRRGPRSVAASAGTAASPARTDAERVAPPATTTSACGSGSRPGPAGPRAPRRRRGRRRRRSDQSRTRWSPEGQVLLALAEALAAAAGHDDRPGGHDRDVTAREIRH